MTSRPAAESAPRDDDAALPDDSAAEAMAR
ncbi:MAG: hypothetical protein MOP51_1727, partial [Citricoccus sp.]|nr:hypothetical protein [Citricoccus sp. WCRC_4]